ncbi:MAG: ABC transporter ATP-binding protein, partial [Deltaproteobacteria bacterium]
MLLAVDGLCFGYGGPPVIDGVSLELEQGHVLGIVGANGSGKSTLLKLIAGVLYPDSGAVKVGGRPVRTPASRGMVGLVPERAPVDERLRLSEYLRLWGLIQGMGRADAAAAAERAAARLGLSGMMNAPVGSLSRGRQRLACLARSLVHGPWLLCLDEPTDGLDRDSSRLVEKVIDEQRKTGSVIMASHRPELVAKSCDRVVLLGGGRLSASLRFDSSLCPEE